MTDYTKEVIINAALWVLVLVLFGVWQHSVAAAGCAAGVWVLYQRLT